MFARSRFDKNWLGGLLAVIYFMICIIGTQPAPGSWNDISRVAAIESLGERGTWVIDDATWSAQTQDKVFLNGKFYSDKMPLLTWMAAGAYSLLYRVGVSLEPDCALCGYYVLTLLFVGIPAAFLIWLVFDFANRQNVSSGIALLVTVALGIGTMILPYSLALNHHLPAAVSLFAAFYLLTTRSAKTERWLAAVGFFAALAVALDPLAAIFAGALFGVALWRYRLRVFYLLLGALLPLLITAWLDVQIAGTIIPPYLIPSGYDYPGSSFPATVGGTGTPDDLPQYAFKMFLGAQGLFSYNPILLFALSGCVIISWRRAHSLRIEAIAFVLASVLLGIYLATRTGNLGGVAYGERYYVHAIPMVMAFLVFVPPLAPKHRWLFAPFFGIALVVSIFSSYQGAQNPWRYVPPPTHPTRDSVTGTIGWRWNVRLPLR